MKNKDEEGFFAFCFGLFFLSVGIPVSVLVAMKGDGGSFLLSFLFFMVFWVPFRVPIRASWERIS